jgi:hypothetical protein
MFKHFGHMLFRMGAKCEMWVMGNQNLPYASQDTNIAIKSYCANLKMTLRAAKSQLFGRQVD